MILLGKQDGLGLIAISLRALSLVPKEQASSRLLAWLVASCLSSDPFLASLLYGNAMS